MSDMKAPVGLMVVFLIIVGVLISANNGNSAISTGTAPIIEPSGSGSGLTAKQVWEYATRTLTSNLTVSVDLTAITDALDDITDLINGLDLSNLDALVSSRATQTSVDTIDGIVDSIKITVESIDLTYLDASIISRANQTSVNILHGIVDDIKATVDAIDLSNLDATVSSRATQASLDLLASKVAYMNNTINSLGASPYIGFTALVTYTQASPTQNQWYTVLDESGAGNLYTVGVTNNGAGSKNFDLTVTLDGVALTKTATSIGAGATNYYYITPSTDTMASSGTTIKWFFSLAGNDLEGSFLSYNTSINVQVRETSASPYSLTVNVRRCTS